MCVLQQSEKYGGMSSRQTVANDEESGASQQLSVAQEENKVYPCRDGDGVRLTQWESGSASALALRSRRRSERTF